MLEHLAMFGAEALICLFWATLFGVVVASVAYSKMDT
jgi:uncharacterized membrane protein